MRILKPSLLLRLGDMHTSASRRILQVGPHSPPLPSPGRVAEMDVTCPPVNVGRSLEGRDGSVLQEGAALVTSGKRADTQLGAGIHIFPLYDFRNPYFSIQQVVYRDPNTIR